MFIVVVCIVIFFGFFKIFLFCSESYAILESVEADGHRLLKMYNPWGNEKEWTGNYCCLYFWLPLKDWFYLF